MFDAFNRGLAAAILAGTLSLVAAAPAQGADATVSGTVRRSADGAPLAGVEVALFSSVDNTVGGRAVTAGDGRYTITAPAGSYRVHTFNRLGLIDEMLPGIACPYRRCDPAGATTLDVAANQQLGAIDFSLDPGAAIAGTVRRAGGTPIAASVSVFDASGAFVGHATTPNGAYVVGGLLPGSYFVRFGASGYASEMRGDVPCPDRACDVTASPPVVVAAQATSAGIDATLSGDGIAPYETVVYLNRCEGDCVVWAGADDAVADSASTVRVVAGRVMSEFGQQGFAELAQCVRSYYERYNLVVVTEDPGTVPHREQMVVDNASQDYGIGPGYDGIVSDFCQSSISNSISLSFAKGVYDPADLCLTSAHEFGHQFTLDHTLYALDVMSHVHVAGRHFADETAQCGEEGVARPCRCGGTTTNSDATLSALLGVRGQAELLRDSFE
ncbi:MAG TPA: carboxypeptidase-like regulatory domain-containing protein [Xanthomonadales bacterium]|nr:carboxypeptidase-like regulatory domain-containing protein [Xanthomonadales bacterium]